MGHFLLSLSKSDNFLYYTPTWGKEKGAIQKNPLLFPAVSGKIEEKLTQEADADAMAGIDGPYHTAAIDLLAAELTVLGMTALL